MELREQMSLWAYWDALPRIARRACGGGGAPPQRAGPRPNDVPHAKSRKPLSEEERSERRRADREFTGQAVEQLRSSEGWQGWIGVVEACPAGALALAGLHLLSLDTEADPRQRRRFGRVVGGP